MNKTGIIRYFQIFVKCTWYLPFTWYWLDDLYPWQRTTKGWFWGEGCFLRLILGVRSIRGFEITFAIPIMNPPSWFMISSIFNWLMFCLQVQQFCWFTVKDICPCIIILVSIIRHKPKRLYFTTVYFTDLIKLSVSFYSILTKPQGNLHHTR